MAATDTVPTPSSVTHDGMTVSGYVDEGDLRSELGIETPETPETPPAAEPEKPAEPKLKADDTVKRINQLTWEKNEERRQREAAEQRARDAESRATRPAEPEKPKAPARDPWSDPNDPEPDIDAFENIRDYQRENNAWNRREWNRETQYRARVESVRQQRESVESTYRERYTAYTAKHPEFAAKLQAVATEPIPRPIVDGVKMAENGLDVLNHLLDHPDELDAIKQLRPIDQYAEIKILSKSLTAAPAGPAPVVKPSTKAEPPISPVVGSHVAVPKDGPPGDESTDDEWFSKIKTPKDLLKYGRA